MDGGGERPRMGKFDLVAFPCANADRIITARASTHAHERMHKRNHSVLCDMA